MVLDHNIRSHWIATLEVEGKANLSKLKKKGGHLLAKWDVYDRKNFVESDYWIVNRLPNVIIFTSYERRAVGSI